MASGEGLYVPPEEFGSGLVTREAMGEGLTVGVVSCPALVDGFAASGGNVARIVEGGGGIVAMGETSTGETEDAPGIGETTETGL